jgi:phage terminase large subunit
VIDSTMTDEDSFIFVFGNPYRKRGRFYELFTRFAHRWITMTWTAGTAKAPNQSKIQADIEDWGLDSDYIRVNVLGEFPRQDADTLIPLPLIEAARVREAAECERYYPVWGWTLPATAMTGRPCASAATAGLRTVEAWRGLDTMQTAGRVKNAYDEAATDDKPTMIVVDVIGVGAGVVDRLRELGLPVRALNVAEAPAVRAKFHRLRDEMYWRGAASGSRV